MKKYILVLCLLVSILSCKKDVKKETALIEFLPNNPTAVIHANSIENLQKQLQNSELLQSFKATDTYKLVQQDFQFLNQIQSDNEILISYATVGKNQSYLFAIPTKGMENKLSYTNNNKQYNNKTYQELSNQKAFAISIDSTLVVSSSEILIENLIRNREDNIQYSDLSLLKLYKASTAATTFFMRSDKLSNYIHTILPTSFLGVKDWLSVELNTESGITSSGLATAINTTHEFASQLKNSIPLKSTAPVIVPENATQFVSYNFEEIKNYNSPFENFEGLIENTAEVVSFQVQEATICAFKVIDENVLDPLQEFSSYRNTTIYKNSFYKIPKQICNQQPQFACFLEGFMLLAASEKDLQNCIAHYQNKTTWGHQSYLKQNQKELLSTSHIVKGVKTKTILKDLATNLKDKTISKVLLKDYPLLMHQVSYEGEYVQFNSVVQKVEAKTETASVSQIANIVLDAALATEPQWVLNHKNKQKEIVVQDVNHILYLISETGKVLWKKQLEAKIKGKIHQIDIYKNRKLQLAFTTDNAFMVLDRNGKKVDPFYKEFKNGGLLPLAVFDYDNSRDYRFVLTQGTEVFMFDNKMKHIKGFKFKKTDTDILQAPKHVRVGSKDYIVIAEKEGKIHIVNRQGKERTAVKNQFDLVENTLQFTAREIVFVDTAGKLQQINVSSGAVKSTDILQDDGGAIVVKNNIKVKLEKQNLTINNKTISLDYGTYTIPKIHYTNRKYYISISDLDTQKVYVYDSKGKLLPNFPVYGKSHIALTASSRKILFTTTAEENALLIYKKN